MTVSEESPQRRVGTTDLGARPVDRDDETDPELAAQALRMLRDLHDGLERLGPATTVVRSV